MQSLATGLFSETKIKYLQGVEHRVLTSVPKGPFVEIATSLCGQACTSNGRI